jgi:hypothetical protein
MLTKTLNRVWLLNGKEYKEMQDVKYLDKKGIVRDGYLKKIHDDKDRVDIVGYHELFPEGKCEMLTKDKLL